MGLHKKTNVIFRKLVFYTLINKNRNKLYFILSLYLETVTTVVTVKCLYPKSTSQHLRELFSLSHKWDM